MATKVFVAVRVFPVELLACQVSMICAANWPRWLNFIHTMSYWVECMTSSVISFAYFTHFSNLNISGTNVQVFGNGKRRFNSFVEF